MSSKFMDKGVAIAVGVLVVGILSAFLLPISIDTMNAPDNTELNQSVGNSQDVTANLEGEVTAIDSTNNNIDVTLRDTKENVNKSATIGEGANATLSMPDGDVTVENKEQSTDYAIVGYEYPKDYGWSNASQGLWGIIPMFFVLAILLMAVRYAKNQG